MRFKLALLGSILALNVAATAQDYAIPPGHESRMGGRRAQHLFSFENIRYQQISGELTNKAHTWNSISFRREQLGRQNTARSWTKMTLSVGSGDFKTFGNTFSTNFAGTSTMVFSGKVSVPGHSPGDIHDPKSEPSSFPTTWGSFVKAGDMRFPFSRTWVHNGKKGIVLDFMLTGGTLANKVVWGAGTQRPYYTDGDWPTDVPYDSISIEGTVSSKCRATGKTAVPKLRPTFISTALKSTSTVYKPNRVAFEFRYQNLQNKANAIGVVSFARFVTGQPVWGSCEKLYMDLTQPFIFVPFVASASGSATLKIADVPYKEKLISARVDTQAAWFDSVKGLQFGSHEWARIRARTDPSLSMRNYNFGPNVTAPGGRAGSPYTSLIPAILLGK